MSFYHIPQKLYADDRPPDKKPKITYMKKEHFRKQDKTKIHKCSQCTRKDARQYFITEKESRWLCPVHVMSYNKRDEKEKPHFIKASNLI